ncbi:hypothetical protein CCMSSC00406_0008139 [Pleurotus cornucopiae]|uniref:Uncharacterized protein n=1 Tax=Pleurotus cornucopiae TaxID=5321 RepID=A0ACB7INE3_PLECO|nr:hypothetical protein CCMSSC00406_0008139 [Pleurotus cornucopiae]
MNSDLQRPPVSLWLLISPTALAFLALMCRSALARKTMFLPIVGIALYVTTIGMSLGDYVIAGAFTAYVFAVFDLLVPTDAHHELRLVDQPPPSAGTLPLFARATWALCVLTSPRPIGWTNEPKNGSIPPRPTDTSRIRFATRQIVYTTFHLLTLKVLSATMTGHISRNGLDLARTGWGWRLVDTLQYGSTTSTWLSVTHRAWTLALLCAGRWAPSDFAPILASLGNAYTLRRFWGPGRL